MDQQLLSLLNQVFENLSDSEIRMSEIGLQLRKLQPGFSPINYGYKNLKALLEENHIGHVFFNNLDTWLRRNSVRYFLKQEWWKAVCFTKIVWFDFESSQLEYKKELVEANPNQFLEVPHISQEKLAHDCHF